MSMNLVGSTIAARIGRRRLLLLMLGALVSSAIAFSTVGSASADHSCVDLTSPHTQEECANLELEAQAPAEDLAQAAFDACVAAPISNGLPPFLAEILCGTSLEEDLTDIDNHSGVYFNEAFDALVAEHLALPEHHASTKADQLSSSGVQGKGIANAPGLQKEFNEKSKAGEKAGKKK